MSHFRMRILDFVLLFLVIGLAILFFPKSGVITTGDTENYVMYAYKFLNGEGFEYLNRGPLFPILIAAAFNFFGISIKSGYLVVRLFFSLNVVISYWLGKTVYNRWVGLVFALLVISSYGINYSARFFLADTITPFFLLLYILLFYKGIVGDQLFYFIIAGITLGFEFLTHEYFAPFFASIPFFLLIACKQYRNKEYIYKIVIMEFCFVITIMPWAVYVLKSEGNLSTLLGQVAAEEGLILPDSWHHLTSQFYRVYGLISEVNYFNALRHFYEAKLYKYFVLAPFLTVFLITMCIKNIFNRKSGDIHVIIAIFVLLPILIAVGHKSYRIGGVSIFFFLLYLVFANVLFEIGLWISRAIEITTKYDLDVRKLGLILFAVLSFTVIMVQWFNTRIPTKIILPNSSSRSREWKNTFWLQNKFVVEGRFNEDVRSATQWLRENVPKGSNVAVAFGHDAINFYTEYAFELISFEVALDHQKFKKRIEEEGFEKIKSRPIFVFPSLNFEKQNKDNRLICFVFEEDILNTIKQSVNKIILVGSRMMFLSIYLDEVGWASLLYDNSRVRIYRIDIDAINNAEDFNIVVSDTYEKYLKAWGKYYPNEVQEYYMLLNRLGIEKEELFEWTYSNFQESWIRNNIPKNATIGFFWHTGKFLVKDDKRAKYIGYNDHRLSNLIIKYDFLFIHNVQRYYNTFPYLFEELDSLKAFHKFPTTYLLSENGWAIYDLRKVKKVINDNKREIGNKALSIN